MSTKPTAEQRKWLILSYLSNSDGSASSQHIDDKLAPLAAMGIEPILLSSPGAAIHERFTHKTALSMAPSGLRFELRNFLRPRCKTKLQFKLLETPLLLPILPLYLLEKIFIDLESEWSWYIRASQKGKQLCHKFNPELIYSTGGPACAHLAAAKIARTTKLPWIAELQDPLLHDTGYHRSKPAFRYYSRLEKRIRTESCATIFMCDAARKNSNQRTGIHNNSHTIYPGAQIQTERTPFRASDKCIFNHFGSLGGSRDASLLIPAILDCIKRDHSLKDILQFNFYGTCDSTTASCISSFPYPGVLRFRGKVSRAQAISEMAQSSCLILIQNREFFSSETIPSKLYEYMHTGRPILALTHHNPEINNILADSGHFSVAADSQKDIARGILTITMLHQSGQLLYCWPQSPWTAKRAVKHLIEIADRCC